MKVITIGRSEENDVVINDSHASRHHLQIIQHDDGHYTLSDFGSTNGTYVNGQKISGEVPLGMNDFVRIGNTTLPWRTYFEAPPPKEHNSGSDAVTEVKVESKDKCRHGFVTFWLWLGIVINLIAIPINLWHFQNLTNLGELGMELIIAGVDITPFFNAIHPHVLVLQMVVGIGGIGLVVCYALLLKWKKIGFWCFGAIGIVVAIVNLIMVNLIEKDYLLVGLAVDLGQTSIIQLISAPISIVILWAILQIKKDGAKCWDLLE